MSSSNEKVNKEAPLEPQKTTETQPQEKAGPAKKKRGFLARLWRLAWRVPLCFLAFIILALIVARLFIFTDNRLRLIANDSLSDLLGTKVTIGQLNIDIPTTIVISDVKIAAPREPFTHDLLNVSKITIDLTFRHLLQKKLYVDEIAIDGLRAALDGSSETGYSYEPILANLMGPPSEEPEPEVEDADSDSAFALPELPVLPIDIIVREVRIKDLEAALYTKELQAIFSSFSFKVSASLIQGELAAAIGINIGESLEKPAQLTWAQYDGNSALLTGGEVPLYLGIKVKSTSLATHNLDLTFYTKPTLRAPYKLEAPALKLDINAAADLNKEEAELATLSMQLAEKQIIGISAVASHFFSILEADLKRFEVHLPLKELAQVAAATFMPGISGEGTIDLTIDPLHFSLANLEDPRNLALNLALKGQKIGARLPSLGVNAAGLDLNLAIGLPTLKELSLALAIKLERAGYQNISAQKVGLNLDTAVPLAPLFAILPHFLPDVYSALPFNKEIYPELSAASDAEKLPLALKVAVKGAGMDNIKAHDLGVNLALDLPLGQLLRQDKEAKSTTLKLNVTLGDATTGQENLRQFTLDLGTTLQPVAIANIINDFLPEIWAKSPSWPASNKAIGATIDIGISEAGQKESAKVKKMHLKLKANSRDYMASRAALALDLKSPSLSYSAPDIGSITVPLACTINAERLSQDSFKLNTLSLDIKELLAVNINGGVANIFSDNIKLDNLAAIISLNSLADLWQLIPQPIKKDLPALTVAGALKLSLNAAGTVPLKTLQRVGKAAGRLDSGLPYLQPLFNFIDKGLPFGANIELALSDLALTMPDTVAADKLNLLVRLTTGEGNRRPEVGLDITAQDLLLANPKIELKDTTLNFALTQELNNIGIKTAYKSASITYDELLNKPLDNLALQLELATIYGGDANGSLLLNAPSIGAEAAINFGIVKPHLVFFNKAWEKSGLPGIDTKASIALKLAQQEATTIMKDSFTTSGEVGVALNFAIKQGLASLLLEADLKDFFFKLDEETVAEEINGHLPLALSLYFDEGPERMVLVKDVPIGGGAIALKLSNDNILKRSTRALYYELLRPYRLKPGLTINKVRAAGLTINELALDLVLTDGILAIDHLRLNTIGGDIKGTMAAQLTAGKAVLLNLGLNFTGIDASTLLSIPSGPDSEINGNIKVNLEKSELSRNINASINITKIGRSTLDRFLQTLDPEEKDDSITGTRKKLKLVWIKGLNIWVKYENLKLHLDYQTKIGIPGTPIAYNPIKPEILGEPYSLSEYLDLYVEPLFRQYLGPILGWHSAIKEEKK